MTTGRDRSAVPPRQASLNDRSVAAAAARAVARYLCTSSFPLLPLADLYPRPASSLFVVPVRAVPTAMSLNSASAIRAVRKLRTWGAPERSCSYTR
jgi:hypothetical protein